MYTVELFSVGGAGGASFDHSQHLQDVGFVLGAAPNGVKLSSLHIEHWETHGKTPILAHHHATYTQLKYPDISIAVPGAGEPAPTGTDLVIPPSHRVAHISLESGFLRTASMANALNFLRLNLLPMYPGQPQVSVQAGRPMFRHDYLYPVGVSTSQVQMPAPAYFIQTRKYGPAWRSEAPVPDGMTLAGLAGRAGQIWDQVRTLLLCVNRLSKDGQLAFVNSHVPPYITEVVVARLFQATFFENNAAAAPPQATRVSARDTDFISQWIAQQVDSTVYLRSSTTFFQERCE
eukprot:gene13149-13279_t